MIKTDGTETSQGYIEHKRHPSGVLCPVRLKVADGNVVMHLMQSQAKYPVPERDRDGRLVYALPGGGRWVV